MKHFARLLRSVAMLSVLASTLFAGTALAANGITASGERYTDGNGNDSRTVSVEFRNIPAEYEGWNATTSESMPVCGVVVNGVVSCEFRRDSAVKGIWLHLYKGIDQHASFYVSFYVPGMKTPKVKDDPCVGNENPENLCATECCPQ